MNMWVKETIQIHIRRCFVLNYYFFGATIENYFACTVTIMKFDSHEYLAHCHTTPFWNDEIS